MVGGTEYSCLCREEFLSHSLTRRYTSWTSIFTTLDYHLVQNCILLLPSTSSCIFLSPSSLSFIPLPSLAHADIPFSHLYLSSRRLVFPRSLLHPRPPNRISGIWGKELKAQRMLRIRGLPKLKERMLRIKGLPNSRTHYPLKPR